MIHMNDQIKHIADTLSIATVVGTLAAWLPPLAALASLIWTCLRIYEMVTGKTISERRKTPRK